MTLSPVPDLKSRRQWVAASLVLWAVSCACLLLVRHVDLGHVLGDPDDALRLSMVRDLAHGQGWFDQKLTRLQPPMGLFMHWSRLVDGGEAGLYQLLALVLPADQAELGMRISWPLLWLLPTIASVLAIARRLAGGKAVFLTAISVAMSVGMSGQFTPGRIDHHNVQIACCLMAFAAAVQAPSLWAAIICGLASALGLAVGLEALPFHALIGAALGLAWAFDRQSGRNVTAYGLALGLGALALCALQTPPQRWFLPVCDALALNLVAGLAVAGAGLAALGRFGARLSLPTRLVMLAGIGFAAGATYLGLDPVCVKGPLAELDPELQRVWQAHVSEMEPWLQLARHEPAGALAFGAPVVCGLLGWLWMGRLRANRTDLTWLLSGLMLIGATALTWEAIRSAEYAVWMAAPLIGAALAGVAASSVMSRMIPAALAVVVINIAPGWITAALVPQKPDGPTARPGMAPVIAGLDPCVDTVALKPLAALPSGPVLSETDEGPYILAETRDSAIAAPYHRMTFGMKQARAMLGATPAAAEGEVRALGVRYVANCPSHAAQSDRWSLPATGLQAALDHGRIPAWLEPITPASAWLQIYRVRPPTR